MTAKPDSTALLDEIETYCREAGIKPSSLGIMVLNNGRFFDRLTRRAKKDAADAAAIRAYITANPPQRRRA